MSRVWNISVVFNQMSRFCNYVKYFPSFVIFHYFLRSTSQTYYAAAHRAIICGWQLSETVRIDFQFMCVFRLYKCVFIKKSIVYIIIYIKCLTYISFNIFSRQQILSL